MLLTRQGSLEPDQRHQMGLSWDYGTAMSSVETSIDEVHPHSSS